MEIHIGATLYMSFASMWFKIKTDKQIIHVEQEELDQSLFKRIRQGEIKFAGNARLKIYGKLSCGSGKRMKKENRVFFKSEAEAVSLGYRACKHCMRERY